MQRQLVLDAIVTVVDSKHVWDHVDEQNEVKEQIAFADVILLNKIDLVAPEDVERLEARIRGMNAAARVHRTTNAHVRMDDILHQLVGYVVYGTILAGAFIVIRAQTGVFLNTLQLAPALVWAPLAMMLLGGLSGIVPAIKAYRTDIADNLPPAS